MGNIPGMSTFCVYLIGPILKEYPIDKHRKQVYNNLLSLIKICNQNIDNKTKIDKIIAWISSARECDIRATAFSNKKLKEACEEYVKDNDIDDDIIERFINLYSYPPLNCKWYDKIIEAIGFEKQ